jgi:hypothetical protein
LLTARLAAQELRQQVRGPVFRIVAIVSLLMVVGAALTESLRIDAISNLGSGPELIIRVHLVWTLFYLFTAAAFVGEAATRDVETGFAPLVRATPVSRPAYLLGRFGGSAAAVLLSFMSVPVGLLAARLLPAANPDWVAPVLPSTYALALLALSVPNLLLACALFLTLATATRSMKGCLVGAVGLLTLYALGSSGGGFAFLFEPFGFVAAQALQTGDPLPLIYNRALWLSIAVLLVVTAIWLDAHTVRRIANERALAATDAEGRPQSLHLSLVAAHHGTSTQLLQLLTRTRHHVGETVTAPPFVVLLLLGLASCLASLWPAVQVQASISDLLIVLVRSFALVPVVVVLFFAGEIHWSDRAHRIDRIINATPVPRTILLLAQVLALSAILLLLALVTGAGVPVLLLVSGRNPEIEAVLSAYVFFKAYDWVLLGVLAWVLQTFSPSKFAGWGYFVLFLIGTMGLIQAGVTDPVVHYGRYPGAPLPPLLSGERGASAYQAAWGIVALLMLAFALRKRTTPI